MDVVWFNKVMKVKVVFMVDRFLCFLYIIKKNIYYFKEKKNSILRKIVFIDKWDKIGFK